MIKCLEFCKTPQKCNMNFGRNVIFSDEFKFSIFGYHDTQRDEEI